MAFPPRYATVQDLRDRGIPQSYLPDATAVEMLDEVSRWVEEYTQQIFYPRIETVHLDGEHHRLLKHPDLWPVLSEEEDVVITENMDRTRIDSSVDVSSLQTLRSIDASEFSMRTNHPRRFIDKSYGVWNEGGHNYDVEAVWGWLEQVNAVEYTTNQAFAVDATQLYLTSVVGLRKHDVGIFDNGTMLTVVAVNKTSNYLVVEGSDLLTATVASGSTFTRWGRVPQGIRDFVVEAIYVSSGVSSSGSGSCAWLKREQTDTYEYEKFSPKDMGMSGGGYFTGNVMIDSGLARHRRPSWVSIV